MNKKTRNIIIAVALLLVLVIGAVLIWNANKPDAQEGGKALVVTVVHGDESSKDFSFTTDAENLRTALEEQELIEGTESEYGLYVTKVDGEDLMTGVDDTMIADGDHYDITLKTGW